MSHGCQKFLVENCFETFLIGKKSSKFFSLLLFLSSSAQPVDPTSTDFVKTNGSNGSDGWSRELQVRHRQLEEKWARFDDTLELVNFKGSWKLRVEVDFSFVVNFVTFLVNGQSSYKILKISRKVSLRALSGLYFIPVVLKWLVLFSDFTSLSPKVFIGPTSIKIQMQEF